MADRKDVLTSALDAVDVRGRSYGTPESNFARIAAFWKRYLANRGAGPDAPIDEADVSAMMVLMKVARLQQSPEHLDSWVDIAGYAACGGEITTRSR